ncbi:MAG: acyltransferase [Alistipes sp.]|nr:acyltransferase [Alistipes sp.]
MSAHTISSTNFANTKPHYEFLDGLRGVAAVLVVFYHIFEGYFCHKQGRPITLLTHGHLAVDFFFMLSGFVISYAYDDRWKKMTLGNFFKRRLIRLHPMVVMSAIIGVISYLLSGSQRFDGTAMPFSAVMGAMLLMIFMIPTRPDSSLELRSGEMFSLNGPMWSLFIEYIGNVLYALILRRLSVRVLAVLAVVFGVVHSWFFLGHMADYGSVALGWVFDEVHFWGGLIRLLFPFTVGMLLARTFKPRKVKGAFWICTIILITIYSLPRIVSESSISLNCLYEVLCIIFILPAVLWLGACGTAKKSFTSRLSNFLGELSYPLYMVHYPIMYLLYGWIINNKETSFGETFAIIALAMLTSVVIAYACLKLYDEPVRKWLARKFVK